MKPFSQGKIPEAQFRLTLAKLREAVPDPAWMTGDDGWPQIVDRMLSTHNYAAGCRDCHRAYIQPYRQSYRARPVEGF
ncbi:MAG: hypothetical protein ACYCWW_07190 [Deltaproteobacteria bacterium]